MFYIKLTELQKKKILKNNSNNSKEKNILSKLKLDSDKDHSKNEEDILEEKGFDLEPVKYGVDKLLNNYLTNCPEQKLTYKIELAKDYLDRDLITSTNEPDIMRIDIFDKSEILTTVEILPSAKILALGQINGIIKIYYLYEKTDCVEIIREDLEEDEDEGDNKKEKKKKEKKQNNDKKDENENKDEDNNNDDENKEKDENDNLDLYLQSKALDFQIDLKKAEFVGHKSAITCININYDSSVFLSGSADGTIR